MIQKKQKTIEGQVEGAKTDVEYEVEQFPAMTGMRIAVKLAKTFGGGIGQAASGGMESVMDMDVSKVITAIVENLDEDATPKLVADLLARTKRNGVHLTPDVIDTVYSANFGELLSALKFVLEVNYGGFMGALAQAGNIGKEQ